MLDYAHRLASRGLRVLMVAEGTADVPADDPSGLIAQGFLGISDPLKPGVRDAVRQCHEAGVRVIMLTGDHPATARAIAHEAGLQHGEVLTGADIAAMDDDQLGAALERTSVIARTTPLDKVRIVDSLQRRGHTVAMTGDGANDGPALRLAEVGISMGRGTEVARQAAEVVLADDDFGTIVQTLVEGRTFWRNIRRALGLLLGGNLGELGLLAGPSVAGLTPPLNTRQILAVNIISDVLPALAIALQRPENGELSGLAREGTAALEAPLRQDIFRRGAVTAAPSLGAYLLALRSIGAAGASTVAFASIVATQLAQTLDLGYSAGRVNPTVLTSVVASGGLMAATLGIAPLRALLGLAAPTAVGWLLIGASAVTAYLLSWLFASDRMEAPSLPETASSPTLAPI
jgi:magnesium-transporting ATPase (P-type)